MRGDQLARQWQLIQRLAHSRMGLGLDELADNLGCVRRTVYRDLDALQFAGFPVIRERRFNRVYYRFIDTFHLGDVPFTADEILALAFSEGLLQTLEGTVFHESIRSALTKIRVGLGPELAGFLEQFEDSFRVLPGPHKPYVKSKKVIRILNQALLARRTVHMRYNTARSGKISTRRFNLYRIWYRNGGLYTIGHDHLSNEIRTFAIDRIKSVVVTDDSFEIPESFDFDSYTSSSFGVMTEDPVTVRIRFSPIWVVHIEERIWHPTQIIKRCADGEIELKMEVGNTAELRNWILSFGSGAEVLKPENLRRDVAEEFAAAKDRYDVS